MKQDIEILQIGICPLLQDFSEYLGLSESKISVSYLETLSYSITNKRQIFRQQQEEHIPEKTN